MENFSNSQNQISLYNFVINGIISALISTRIVCKLAWYLTRVQNVVQYLSLERDNARRYLNTVYIGATGKKLWKLVRQANSTGKAVARIRSDPYKYVYALGVSSYTCVIILAMQNTT